MKRILIVDDNESIHKDFKKVLQGNPADKLRDVELALFGDEEQATSPFDEAQYDIGDAYQGEEAIDMVDRAAAEGRPYALVFMDVRMPPGIDGIVAVAEIWKRHPETEMVICTAHSDYSWGEMLSEIGITDKLQFIRKPFDMVSIQQLALSLTKKWELTQQTKATIKELEHEIGQRQNAEHELRKLNDELESRIEARTAELSQTNAELKNALNSLREAQAHLVASEKMAALGGLVAGIAHEINTPVGIGVTAASHLVQKTRHLQQLYRDHAMKKSDLDNYLSTSSEATQMILSNLDRASELIHSFKQVAVDQSSEERRRFRVCSYIHEVLLSLRPKLKKTKHKIRVTCPEDCELDSFPGAFGQIVSNLVMNSLIHAFEDDSSGEIEIEVREEPDHLLLVYRDNGKGISADHRKKIFDPFFTTRRGDGGSGLGLHIVYNIATQTLGGNIGCESVLGDHTLFKLNIPKKPRNGGSHDQS